MMKTMRQPTLETMGLGTVLEIFKNGKLPKTTSELVDEVFGPAGNRGSLIISGANGIVGAGKSMQFGTRLQPYDVPIIALDFPGATNGIGQQYQGLVRGFGAERATAVMKNITQMSYDGKTLPAKLKDYNPRFLLEAIPEILEIKKDHYKIFQDAFEGIEIRSVTSGFPKSQLGVGIAHPAFPHEINKIWEIVEDKPSAITQLLWSLGMIPLKVSDDRSLVLDVLFCGITLAGTRYHHATNMPYWKIDKFVRKMFGPNPFRAHDAIGAQGANFLTWSCLHHLSKVYGDLFTPTREMEERKDSGQNWYPLNHFRPLVNWPLEDDDLDDFEAWILGPIFQMASLMLSEKRAHLTNMNAIGELCAQFTKGIVALTRDYGYDSIMKVVNAYHKFHPEAAQKAWYPAVFENMGQPEWQQLYVNAEHDGQAGVLTISRESYNWELDAELNRAIDWLKAEGIKQVIVSGDFHLSTQMVGADTTDFYPAFTDAQMALKIPESWSKTARRLYNEFEVSVGVVTGKRCLGGFLELMTHCHYLLADQNASLGMPEVTLPVVPGMEGCHWPLRKAAKENWPKLFNLLLTGKPVRAKDAVGWLVDYAGSMEDTLQTAWKIVSDKGHGLPLRKVEEGPLSGLPDIGSLEAADDPAMEKARKAIFDTICASTGTKLSDALDVQAKCSADFMQSKHCLNGVIGAMYKKTTRV